MWAHRRPGHRLGQRKALDYGVNFFHVANVYGCRHSEELSGKAMKVRRDRFVLARNIGSWEFDREAGHSSYPTVEKLIAGVESDLSRL